MNGPREIVTKTLVCDGCPMLCTSDWREELDNDEVDSGTSADCKAVNRNITAYWHRMRPTPSWCPYLTKEK